MFRAACARGDEGVVAKRADAPYRAGRSKDWLKFKCVRDQEFVIGGWTDPKGGRDVFGALLLGYYDGDTLVYAGRVGTGFDDALLSRIGRQLGPLAADDVAVRPREGHRPRTCTGCGPSSSARSAFSEWTRDGMLRHPASRACAPTRRRGRSSARPAEPVSAIT